MSRVQSQTKPCTLLPADDQGAARGDAFAPATHDLPHEAPVVIQQRLPCLAAPGHRNVVPPALGITGGLTMPAQNMFVNISCS